MISGAHTPDADLSCSRWRDRQSRASSLAATRPPRQSVDRCAPLQVGFVRDENDERLNGRTGPWSEERPKEEMLRDFDSFNDNVKRLLQAISKPSIWGIWELPKLRTSIDEKIVLIGDAVSDDLLRIERSANDLRRRTPPHLIKARALDKALRYGALHVRLQLELMKRLAGCSLHWRAPCTGGGPGNHQARPQPGCPQGARGLPRDTA